MECGRRTLGGGRCIALLPLLASLVLIAMLSPTARAQTDAGVDSDRPAIVNLGIGTAVLYMKFVEDSRSGSTWEFGNSQQFRATLDRHVSTNTMIGVTLGYSPLAMVYRRTTFEGDGPVACSTGCDAEADYWSLGATIRFVSGPGWHHIGELNLAVSQFSNFRELTTRTRLAPLDADRDLSLTGGYGFGWRAGRLFQAGLIGDVGFALHGKSGSDFPRTGLTWIGMLRAVVRSEM